MTFYCLLNTQYLHGAKFVYITFPLPFSSTKQWYQRYSELCFCARNSKNWDPVIWMPTLRKSNKDKGIFPILPMCAVATASFMDSFCYQIIVPNLPFAVQKWFPAVFICLIAWCLDQWNRSWILLWIYHFLLFSRWNFWFFFLGVVCWLFWSSIFCFNLFISYS